MTLGNALLPLGCSYALKHTWIDMQQRTHTCRCQVADGSTSTDTLRSRVSVTPGFQRSQASAAIPRPLVRRIEMAGRSALRWPARQRTNIPGRVGSHQRDYLLRALFLGQVWLASGSLTIL